MSDGLTMQGLIDAFKEAITALSEAVGHGDHSAKIEAALAKLDGSGSSEPASEETEAASE